MCKVIWKLEIFSDPQHKKQRETCSSTDENEKIKHDEVHDEEHEDHDEHDEDHVEEHDEDIDSHTTDKK